VIRLWAGRLRNHGSIPGGGKRLLISEMSVGYCRDRSESQAQYNTYNELLVSQCRTVHRNCGAARVRESRSEVTAGGSAGRRSFSVVTTDDSLKTVSDSITPSGVQD
jgi:hypothetical protein